VGGSTSNGWGATDVTSYSDSGAVRTVAPGTLFDMANSKNVVVVDDASFEAEVLKADKPVLVDFGATWCGPCKALAPVVAGLADETVGKYKIVTVDIDDAPGVAQKYGIRGVPTLAVFRGGAKTASHVGVTTKAKLIELLETT
jgi:thioredoxin 1